MSSSGNGSPTLYQITKHKFQDVDSRIKRQLHQIMTVALQLHILLLKELNKKIKSLKDTNSLTLLHVERVEVSKYIRFLEVELFVLEQMNHQIEEKDRDLFYVKIKTPLKEVIETLSKTMELQPDALETFPNETNDETPEFPKLYATQFTILEWSSVGKILLEFRGMISRVLSSWLIVKESFDYIHTNVDQVQEQDQDLSYNKIKPPLIKAIETLSKLLKLSPDDLETFLDGTNDETQEFSNFFTTKLAFSECSVSGKELLKLYILFERVSSLLLTLKENVDQFQNETEKLFVNVPEREDQMEKFSLLKAASYPVAGALLGGLVLGFIAIFAGFKIASTFAVIGGILALLNS